MIVGAVVGAAIVNGAITPLIVWLVAGAIAMGWQFTNIERWTGTTHL